MTDATFAALITSLLERVVMFGDPNTLGSARAPNFTFLITDKDRENVLAQAIQGFEPFKSRPVRGDDMASTPFVAVTVKPSWSVKDLAIAILHELCHPADRRMRSLDLMPLLRQTMVTRGVRVVHLISAHNLLGVDPRLRSQLMCLLKDLQADRNNPLRIVFSGQPGLQKLLADDPQLSRRSNVVDLTKNIVHFI